MAHHVSALAKADLEDIWEYLCHQSGSSEVADRQIDAITRRFYLVSRRPYMGRPRDDDLGQSSRSFPVGRYIIVYRIVDQDVLILRVAHSGRDLRALMGG
jgi:toxin ParE1/3/4